MADETLVINGEPVVVPENVTENPDGSFTVTPPDAKPAADKDRPSWLPEGFESPEDFAKAYSDLKSKADPVVSAEIVTAKAAEQAVKASGVDLDALGLEFVKDGKLSDASVKVLTDKGIAPETVEAYVDGKKTEAQAFVTKIAASVGGRDALDSMLKWAATGLSQSEADAVNRMLRTDEGTAKVALLGLKAQYEAANGALPAARINAPGIPPATGPKPYASSAEMIRDMQDRRYAEDPAFRDKVARRLEASEGIVNVSSNRIQM